MLTFVNRAQAKKQAGVAYLGGINASSKIVKNAKLGVDTYILYLAPAKSSGYQVCAKATADCIAACLNESGQNRINTQGTITKARQLKTRLFFEDRPFFMRWLVAEIEAARNRADLRGHEFTIRLNGTSDLSPELFQLDGKNIFQLFPDVKLYDYTKVFNRTRLVEKYPNYDLTFSFSGTNWLECEAALAKGVRVAAVFENRLPAFYRDIPVIDGDYSDVRFLDAKNVVVGLKYKKVRTKIDFTKQKFVIQENDADCIY